MPPVQTRPAPGRPGARRCPGRRRRRTARPPARGRALPAAARRDRRSRTYGGFATMRSNGPATASSTSVRTKSMRGSTPCRAALRRATSSAAPEMSVATMCARSAARARARPPGIRCPCTRRRRQPAGRAAERARAAASTMSSVSGRGISTAGETSNVETPELLVAGDVGERLARARAGRRARRSGGETGRRRLAPT